MHYLKCISCDKKFRPDEIVYTCSCGSILEAIIDIDETKNVFDGRDPHVWKYSSFLPVKKKVSLNEGGTPLYESKSLKDRWGYKRLFIKNEGENPTCSFKDRGMTVGVSKAMELGMKKVVCASTGNTSASLAAYSARAGLECFVVIPAGKIALGKLAQAIVYGAKVIPINGNFDKALEAVVSASKEFGIYLLNSINPYRIEGQKTIAFEIFDQLGEVPDRIILPVGNAGNISAIWKGFKEMKKAGITEDLPKMTGIQAEGSMPVVRMYKENTDVLTPEKKPETRATAIRIGNPVSWRKAISAVRDSNGLMESVTDEEILSAQRLLASREGIFVEPASASSVAGLIKLQEIDVIDSDETTVLITTGHGLKDPDIVTESIRTMPPIDYDVRALRKAMGDKDEI
ncbi:MAG: threonine synthase [Candidatus Methanofastidiosia archaeon]